MNNIIRIEEYASQNGNAAVAIIGASYVALALCECFQTHLRAMPCLLLPEILKKR